VEVWCVRVGGKVRSTHQRAAGVRTVRRGGRTRGSARARWRDAEAGGVRVGSIAVEEGESRRCGPEEEADGEVRPQPVNIGRKSL
jgi:hypothetical protein